MQHACRCPASRPPEDLDELRRWARSNRLPAVLAQRARILLLAAEGVTNTQIAERVGVSRPTVIACRHRYVRRGLGGLVDRPRPGRPQTVRRWRRAEILSVTLNPPPPRLGITHWSTRLLAGELGVSRDTVARIWREYGLQPWRAETFSSPPTQSWSPRPTTSSGSTCTHPSARSSSGWTRSPRSKPWNAPSPSAACGRDAPSSTPMTTPATARPPCSPRWRSPPEVSSTSATPAPPSRIPGLPQAGRPRLAPPAVARGLRQLRYPQAPSRACLAGQAPAGPAALHPDLGVVAEPRRGVLLHHRAPGATPWRLRQRHRPHRRISRFCAAWNEHCQPFSWTKPADEILAKLQQDAAATDR
jgi:transposase